MGHSVADFRSDTVTRPTAAMRRAMADAEVGDDVFGDDPTVRRLEETVAGLLGRAAALFVPTGCMGNQIAARLQASPGEEVAVEGAAHAFDWELAGLAALSGLQARPLPSVRGAIDLAAARAALRPAGGFRPRCGLLMVENTHNFHGGAVVPVEHLRALRAVAAERGAAVHLDGARLWNAAAASGTPLEAYGATADTILVAMSKGLGAPVGSLLVGEPEFVARARETRKLLGGGMRQVGVLAAAALVGLRDHRERLVDDHRRARALADALCAARGVEVPGGLVETNIVLVRGPRLDGARLVRGMAERGVLALAAGPDGLRFVTHYDVDDDDVRRAVAAFHEALAA